MIETKRFTIPISSSANIGKSTAEFKKKKKRGKNEKRQMAGSC